MNKKIYVVDIGSNDEINLEDCFVKFENNLSEYDLSKMDCYEIDNDEINDKLLLKITKRFHRYTPRMYMMSCIVGNYFTTPFTDEQIITLTNVLFETWLKDESNTPICVISDEMIRMLSDGEATIDDLVAMAGRQLAYKINVNLC